MIAVEADHRYTVGGYGEGARNGVSTEPLIVTLISHLHIVPTVPSIHRVGIRIGCRSCSWVIGLLNLKTGEGDLLGAGGRRDNPPLSMNCIYINNDQRVIVTCSMLSG